MLKIATPISHLFKNEADGKRIAQASDCLECREWCIDTKVSGQELIHFDVNINMHWDAKERDYVKRCVIGKSELKLITFQMASCYINPPIVDGMFQPQGERVPREKMLANVRENAAWVRSILDKGVQIGIENNNYYPTAAYDDVTDGSFIRQAVEENKLRFLLDVAHAKVTAQNRPIRYEAYLESLPMSSLAQIHICTPKINEKGLGVDAHEAPDAEILGAVYDVATRYRIDYLTVEYYKDTNRLIASLNELRELKKKIIANSGLYT